MHDEIVRLQRVVSEYWDWAASVVENPTETKGRPQRQATLGSRETPVEDKATPNVRRAFYVRYSHCDTRPTRVPPMMHVVTSLYLSFRMAHHASVLCGEGRALQKNSDIPEHRNAAESESGNVDAFFAFHFKEECLFPETNH